MKIWVDMDNAPHVLILSPLIREIISRGHDVDITARDYGQTFQLLDLFGYKYRKIGSHAGKNIFKKIISILHRSVNLYLYARRKRYDLALCHGSRRHCCAL